MAHEATADPATAPAFLKGHVKWDGCSNWHFLPGDSCAMHFCDRDQAEGIGRLLGELYRLAEELVPNWNG